MSTIVHTNGREDSNLGNAFVVKEDLSECQRKYDAASRFEQASIRLTLISHKPIVLPFGMIHCFEARDRDAA